MATDRKRHRWNPGGTWPSSHHVKTCEDCGAVAYKTGQRAGYMIRLRGETDLTYHRRMIPCPGGPNAVTKVSDQPVIR